MADGGLISSTESSSNWIKCSEGRRGYCLFCSTGESLTYGEELTKLRRFYVPQRFRASVLESRRGLSSHQPTEVACGPYVSPLLLSRVTWSRTLSLKQQQSRSERIRTLRK